MRGGRAPLAGIGKSHGVFWAEGKNKGTLRQDGSVPANTKPDGTRSKAQRTGNDKELPFRLGMVAHTFKPNVGEAETRKSLEASLVHINKFQDSQGYIERPCHNHYTN